MSNDHLVLVSGESGTGKSASLEKLKDPKGVMYLGTEAGKKLPFKNVFLKATITDPLQIFGYMEKAEEMPEVHTIVIDSLTYMMDQFETIYVIGSENTMGGWQDYQQFFKKLLQQKVASSTKSVAFTAHTQSILNESAMVMEAKVPIKGALKANGVESYFSNVISTKKMPLLKLEGYENSLLSFTEDEKLLGYKHVYQTRLTKETVQERIKSPMGMWSVAETYIDNNLQMVIDRLDEYYGEE
jgi:archaellum biogenesis ATPase FlaH